MEYSILKEIAHLANEAQFFWVVYSSSSVRSIHYNLNDASNMIDWLNRGGNSRGHVYYSIARIPLLNISENQSDKLVDRKVKYNRGKWKKPGRMNSPCDNKNGEKNEREYGKIEWYGSGSKTGENQYCRQ